MASHIPLLEKAQKNKGHYPSLVPSKHVTEKDTTAN